MEDKNTAAPKEEVKTKLFREKSLEAVESPEALNDYLRVTSPGVWLVLAAIIILLVGGILWSIFGRVETTVQVAVAVTEDGTVCYIPYAQMEDVVSSGTVTVEEKAFPIRIDEKTRMVTVTEEMNPFLRVAGNLSLGDVTVETALKADLDPGIYSGTAVTESLQPISLLLQ